jgi:hypothetical protein
LSWPIGRTDWLQGKQIMPLQGVKHSLYLFLSFGGERSITAHSTDCRLDRHDSGIIAYMYHFFNELKRKCPLAHTILASHVSYALWG